MTGETQPRPLTMTEAVIPILALVVLVGLSFYLFGDAGAKGPNQVALVLAAMIGLVIGRCAGYTAEQLREAAIASVGTGVGAIFILFAFGAGAVISGAYFGDKSSPLSDTANLAAAVGGADLYHHLREVLWTSIPAFGITLAIFFMGSPGDFDATGKLDNIRSTFDVSLVHFLPLGVVIVLAARRVPPFTTIMMGALAGAWLALASGYTSTTGYEAIDQLASRGGMERMLDTIWLIIVALAFGGVVEKAGVIERLIAPVLAAVRSNGSLVAATVGSTVATNAVTADQYIAIVLPGRMFKAAFQQRGLAPVVLSRSLGDSATVTSA
jgi:NhaC family Na+:H+ antiporter